jgi:DNA polymerase (family 10)
MRRQKSKVHDIDFVVVAKSDAQWQKINEKLKQLKAKPNCSGNSVIKAFVPCQDGLFQVDFYCAKPSTFGIHLLVRTGSAEHNMWLAGYAISKGMRIKYNEGLIKDGMVIAGKTEQEVFEALGLPYSCPPSGR